MDNRPFKLINIEEYFHAKFQRKIFKIRLCPVKIIEDRDGYEYNFSDFIDFIFPNNKEIFDYFSNNHEELKYINILNFNKDSSGLSSSEEQFIYVEKTLYQQQNRRSENQWLSFLTKLKNESDLEKKREVTRKSIQGKILLKFIKKNNEIFYISNPKNDINYHILNEGKDFTFLMFFEHLLDDSCKDSIFIDKTFKYDNNGQFEVELSYEVTEHFIGTPLPILIENMGFSKYEVIHSTLFFLKNFFSPSLGENMSDIFSKEILQLKNALIGAENYIEKKLYIKLMKDDFSISAIRPKRIISETSTTGSEALKVAIIEFLQTLQKSSFETEVFKNDDIVYRSDGVFEIQLSFKYNLYQTNVGYPKMIQNHGFSKDEIIDNVLWLSRKFMNIKFTKEERESCGEL